MTAFVGRRLATNKRYTPGTCRRPGAATRRLIRYNRGMIRIGIIGLGFMGKTHYGVYERNPEAQVVAIADSDPKRAAGDLSG